MSVLGGKQLMRPKFMVNALVDDLTGKMISFDLPCLLGEVADDLPFPEIGVETHVGVCAYIERIEARPHAYVNFALVNGEMHKVRPDFHVWVL